MITIAQPVIANPMYDTVFKRLMNNERMARFFIGTLLGKTMEKLGVGHDETTWPADAHLESMATMKEWEEKERKTRERKEREVTEKAKEVMEKEREETKKAIENVQQVPDVLVQLKDRES